MLCSFMVRVNSQDRILLYSRELVFFSEETNESRKRYNKDSALPKQEFEALKSDGGICRH